MSKKVFASSMALVLATTMVLAVGKTRQLDKADEMPVTVEHAEPALETDIKPAVVVPIVSSESVVRPVKPMKTVVIPAEIDESEMILSTDHPITQQQLQATEHPLLQSLARVEGALQHLEALAANAHATVAALEHQYPLR